MSCICRSRCWTKSKVEKPDQGLEDAHSAAGIAFMTGEEKAMEGIGQPWQQLAQYLYDTAKEPFDKKDVAQIEDNSSQECPSQIRGLCLKQVRDKAAALGANAAHGKGKKK